MVNVETIKELVLALLYLTPWEEKEYDKTYHRSWKGYPFSILDELVDEGLISGNHKSKSVYFTEKGVEKAMEIIEKYNFSGDDLDE